MGNIKWCQVVWTNMSHEESKPIVTSKTSNLADTPSSMEGAGVGIRLLESRNACPTEAWTFFRLDFQLYMKAMDNVQFRIRRTWTKNQNRGRWLWCYILLELRLPFIFTAFGMNIEDAKLMDLIKCFDVMSITQRKITSRWKGISLSHTHKESKP